VKIVDVICVSGRTGFYRDDQMAIRAGAEYDGFLYTGTPVTPGFSSVREPGESVSVMIMLSDGQVGIGDCAEVQYSGAAGREAVFRAESAIRIVSERVAPLLIGRELRGFRELAEQIDGHLHDADRLPASVRYGTTQAILHAAALTRGLTMAEIVRDEYDTEVEILPVPMYAQTGDERRINVDKMILKEVDVLPHGLINNVETKLGVDGGLLKDYIRWLSGRIQTVRLNPDYKPRLHIDTYGTIGIAFSSNLDRIADYLGELEKCAAPFRLRIEHPIDAGSRDAQIEVFAALRALLSGRSIRVELVADEWCNTLEDIEAFVSARAADVIHVKTPDLGGINNTITALLLIRANGLAAFCGGTCNETDISGRVCANVAMACGADQVLAKPGMGVDEGLMIVGNEMARTAALAAARSRTAGLPSLTVGG
jgi:methylaspartate ammonia-lyase